MRLYWVDVDELIVEPRATSGNVRFIASVRGPIHFGMALLEDEDGLGSLGGPALQPHLFAVILSLEKANGETFDTYTFRYVPGMTATRETREFTAGEVDDREDGSSGY